MPSSKICAIIPFVPEVPPVWIPEHAYLIADGVTEDNRHSLNKFQGHAALTGIRHIEINTDKRHGFGRNVNRGIELAHQHGYKYALVWNSDAKPYGSPDGWNVWKERETDSDSAWLEALAAPMEAEPCIAAVAPAKVPDDFEREQIEGSPDKDVILHYEPTSQGAMGTPGKFGESCSVFGFGYAPLYLVRIEAFLAVGGHDDLFAGGFFEDADMWIRLRRFGWSTVVAGGCLYRHGDPEVGNTQSYKKLYPDSVIRGQGIRAHRLLLTKWGVYPPLAQPLRFSFLDHRRPKDSDADPKQPPDDVALALDRRRQVEASRAAEQASEGDAHPPALGDVIVTC